MEHKQESPDTPVFEEWQTGKFEGVTCSYDLGIISLYNERGSKSIKIKMMPETLWAWTPELLDLLQGFIDNKRKES